MQLPIHTKLYEYVIRRTRSASRNLIINSIPEASKPGLLFHICAIPCLHSKRINVVRDFRLAQLIHIVPDFMGNAPSEQRSTSAGSRSAAYKPGSRAIANTNMVARSIHERAREHTHIADILSGSHGIFIACNIHIRINNTLCFVCNKKHFFPCKDILIHSVHSIRAKPCFHAVSRKGKQYARRRDFRRILYRCLRKITICAAMGIQFVHIRLNCFFTFGFVHIIPTGKFKHRNTRHTLAVADMQLDFFRLPASVCKVIHTSARVCQRTDFRRCNVVSAGFQLYCTAPPDTGFAKILCRYQ